MSDMVNTSYGTGRVVDSQTVRGRTSYKVEGDAFSIWIDAAQLQFDESPAHVDYENSTTLPYNPTPQYPSDVYEYPLLNQGIDPETRLHPSDSLTGEERDYPAGPGPAPHLFAEGSYNEDPRFASVAEDIDKDSIIARLNHDPVRLAQELQQAHHAGRDDELDPSLVAYFEASQHDPELRTAAWADVRAKGVRIRKDGQVEPIGVTPESIYAYVMGDHNVYETIVVRGNAFTGSHSITEWDCTCEWGYWAFKRADTFVGRLCSHAYAAYLEMQSAHKRKDKGNAWYASKQPERTAAAVGDYKSWCSQVGADPMDLEAFQDWDYEYGANLSASDQDELRAWARSVNLYQGAHTANEDTGLTSAGEDPAGDDGGAMGYAFQPEPDPMSDMLASKTASHQDVVFLSGMAVENGWTVTENKDLTFGNVATLDLRFGSEYIVHVKLGKPPATMSEAFVSASLCTMDPLGWAAQLLAETGNRNVVGDWLQLYFLDDHLGGRKGHEPPPGHLTLERGSFDLEQRDIPFNPAHYRDTVDNERGLIATGSAIGIESAIVDIERVSDPEDQALLDRLRDLSRENQRLQHAEERNLEMRTVVRELRNRGYNAENLTAAIEVHEASGFPESLPHEPFNGSGRAEDPVLTTSEEYDRHQRSDREIVSEPGMNPVISRNISQMANNDQYIADRLGHTAAVEDDDDGDHGFRPTTMAAIQANFDTEDPAPEGAEGGIKRAGGNVGVDMEDPAMAMFAPAPREAANADLSHLMEGGGGNAYGMGSSQPTEASGDGDLSYLMEGMPRTAGRVFTPGEQDALINEASADGAPIDQSELNLAGTHYLA